MLPGFEFSAHAQDMLQECHILEEWVWRALSPLQIGRK